MGRPRHGDKEIWEKVVHNLSVWQRRAIVATLMIAAKPVPDYLQPDAKWVAEEVGRHLSKHGGPMKTGAELISEERQRQISEEGWTAEHDDEHSASELARAATVYACPPRFRTVIQSSRMWPWDWETYKPGNRISELVKAGALIAAEIDRLQRIGGASQQGYEADVLRRENRKSVE